MKQFELCNSELRDKKYVQSLKYKMHTKKSCCLNSCSQKKREKELSLLSTVVHIMKREREMPGEGKNKITNNDRRKKAIPIF